MSWTKSYSAVWSNQVLAKADKKDCIELEGNIYFPSNSLAKDFFTESTKKTICGWKGEASYLNVVVNGKTNLDCCWYYPNPKKEAEKIKGYYAFWKGVKVNKIYFNSRLKILLKNLMNKFLFKISTFFLIG